MAAIPGIGGFGHLGRHAKASACLSPRARRLYRAPMSDLAPAASSELFAAGAAGTGESRWRIVALEGTRNARPFNRETFLNTITRLPTR